MPMRTEEEESLLRLGEHCVQASFEEQPGLESRNKQKKKEPVMSVPYEWDSLIEHSILERTCICAAPNTSVQQLGLSWEQDDDESEEDDSFLLEGLPDNRQEHSVISDVKKTPIPLGRSSNLNYFGEACRDLEESEKKCVDEPTERELPLVAQLNKSTDEGTKENNRCVLEMATKAKKKKPTTKSEQKAVEGRIDNIAKVAVTPSSKMSPSASELLEKLLLSAASSDSNDKDFTHPVVNGTKRGEEVKGSRTRVDHSPVLLDKMNNLNSVLRKLKKERKKKMKKKQSFNVAEHISNDPQLKEDMHGLYFMLKDVLRVQSLSTLHEDDATLDGNESILDDEDEMNEHEPDTIDFVIDLLAGMFMPVRNFFGSVSSKTCATPSTTVDKNKPHVHSTKITRILKSCEAPCVQPYAELPKPGISFSYSLDEEEEKPRGDLLDYIAKELEELGVPIDTSHSSFSSDEEETEDDLTNFMVIGR